MEEHSAPPERLVDVAATAGVSTATAYRHFASVDDLLQAGMIALTECAQRHDRPGEDGFAAYAQNSGMSFE